MNEAEPQTVRDLVIRSLEAEFGPARTAADVHTWAIDVGLGPGYAAVNVSVNCVCTPDDVNIWIFDPHVVKRSDGARYLTVPKRDTVGDVVQQVKHHLMRTRQRVRRRQGQQPRPAPDGGSMQY